MMNIETLVQVARKLVQARETINVSEISIVVQTLETAHQQLNEGYAELRCILRHNPHPQSQAAATLDTEALVNAANNLQFSLYRKEPLPFSRFVQSFTYLTDTGKKERYDLLVCVAKQNTYELYSPAALNR